jgi:hypothetical protein
MKKRIFKTAMIVVAAMFIAGAAIAACATDVTSKTAKKTDLEEAGLKGKVASVEETTYDAVEKFGEISKGKRREGSSHSLHKYDEKGNCIEENKYNSDGRLDSKYIYRYDEKGNQTEMNSYNSDGSLDRKYTYRYDEKGNRTEMNRHNSEGNLEYKTTWKYNEKGNITEESGYNSDGSMMGKIAVKYDEKGNRIEMNTNNSDGSLSAQANCEYKYDNKDNWIEQVIQESEAGTAKKTYTIVERQIEYYE